MFYQDSTFTSQMTVVSERFLEGSANCSLHLPPSLVPGSKLHELLTCLTHIPPSHGKRPIMSLLLGYSLGVFGGVAFWSVIFNRTAERPVN